MSDSDFCFTTNPLQSLFNNGECKADIKLYNKETILYFKNQENNSLCYWLQRGCISIVRLKDNVRTLPLTQNSCVGLLGGPYFMNHYALVADINSAIYSKQCSHVREFISHKHQWEIIVDEQIKKADVYIEYFDGLSVRDSYKEICFLIKIMIKLPSYIRSQIKLSHFLGCRSSISRSNLMQILSHLKSKKFIIVENGFLVSVIHLPNSRFW